MPTLFESPPKKTVFAKPDKPVNVGMKKPEKFPNKMRPLTSFAVNPDGVRFETQEPQEKVILFLRQHLIVNIPWVLFTIILLLAPTILVPFAYQFLPNDFVSHPSYVLVGTAFWYVATFGFALASFIHWFFNIYIVTSERIVDIDFIHLLYKRFSQAELTKIQDISYSAGGIVATVFNFGNVVIETAGEAPSLEFFAVPHPDRVVETIRTLEEQVKNEGLL